MSTMLAHALPISVGIMAGILGFALGVLLQQNSSYRSLEAAMVEDPYIYQSRRNIYDALKLLKRRQIRPKTPFFNPDRTIVDDLNDARGSDGDHTESTVDRPDSIVGTFLYWFQTNMNILDFFFAFSLGSRTVSSVDSPHVATIMKYGFPGLDDIHIYRNFVLSYDRRNRIAHWVCEYLKGSELSAVNSGDVTIPNSFIEDPNIPTMFRANQRDFEHSDWVTCQLACPSNYKFDQICLTETYVMANVVPISRSLKQNAWVPLEAHVRNLAMQYGALRVYSGPLYMPQRITFRNWAVRHQVIGVNTVAVPTHLFKVIITETKSEKEQPLIKGYLLPNVDVDKNVDLNAFESDVRDIEHFAGLQFTEPTYHGHNRDDMSE